MTAITTYATLVENIQAIAEDDGVEFLMYIPTAVDLAEERLFKELDLMDLETKVTGTLSAATLNKPAGYRFGNHFAITVAGKKKLLKKRLEDYIIDYWPDPAVTDIPEYYCDLSSTQFLVAPTPSASYTYEIKCTGQPTKLSVSNPTNYFITNCKDILYAACMSEMARFMKAWSQQESFEAIYANARDTFNIEMMRRRRDNGEVPQNPSGGPNSLKHTVQSTS